MIDAVTGFANLLLLLAASFIFVFDQESQSTCTCVKEPEADRGKAVIFGEPVYVPALSFAFVQQETGLPVHPEWVKVFYSWEWIEYPYQEHPWGAWSTASEVWECQATGSKLEVAARTVRPRGWYAGKYTKWPWPKKPRFEEVSLRISMGGSRMNTFSFKPKELKRMARAVTTIQLSEPRP